jgi:hypothetical protein
VVNPASPTSTSDNNADAWSDSGALYEFKTFTHGGADATYVESGGPALLNADVWSVNLKTGKRTRLTANPDYDEDNAVSPNGQLLALWSNRTMHMVDWYSGLLPVRDFIDTPAALMSLSISSSNKRCHGPIWVLPSSGDQGGSLLGEPIVDYRVPHVFVTNNLTGWPQWSPNGTMLALNTTNKPTRFRIPGPRSVPPRRSLPGIQAHPAAPRSQLTTWVLGGPADRVPPRVRLRRYPHLRRPRRRYGHRRLRPGIRRALRRAVSGIELRRGRFEIAVDGGSVGSIDRHQTVEVPVEPGRHTLQIRAGRYASRAEAFEVTDGETVNFRCHGAMVWPRYVASIVAPNLGISLKRE